MASLTISQDLKELRDHLLEGVKIVEPRATECIPGTRNKILTDVATITDGLDGANIICIRGAPGSGKSSISLSAKSMLYRQRRLITYFRFDRNEAATTTPTALWRHVVYGLARQLPSLRATFLQKLRENEVDLDSARDVFASLVEEPLSNMNDTVDRPLVMVIDALDECGGLDGHLSTDRQLLLQTLGRWNRLPKHFKLLITSRPEGDITRVLSSISMSIDIASGNFLDDYPREHVSIEATRDIRLFLESRLKLIRESSLPPEWPGQDMITKMVRRAAGNFMWVTTATNFIDSGINTQERLDIIMGDAPGSECMHPLYSLYSAMLDTSFGKIADNSSEAEVLRVVFGVIVFAQRSLDDIEYTSLPTTIPVNMTLLKKIRDRLSSVIAQGRSLRFIHKSFDDFLLSEECPTKYAIRRDESQHLLTNLCLTTMTKGLHFNMCHLETSSLRNADVPNIEKKVAKGIPSLLSYSCLFLADHLSATTFDIYTMDRIKDMIVDKLLYWFEAMSLLKEVNRVSHSLLAVLKWSHLSPDDEFKDFLHDARRFLGAFIHPIAQSASHIYISALPFAPENSSVAKHFLSRFPCTLALSTGKPASWSPCIFTSEYHNSRVNSIYFSPDERYFVSASTDQTVCVCDSETGNLIFGPFDGNQSVFDPNGRRVWTKVSEHKLACWDTETGDQLNAFITPSVLRFALRRSNDGSQNLVTASETEIAVWSMTTGRCLSLSNYYYSSCISISPDGCYIAHRTDDSIMIWKVVDRRDRIEIEKASHSDSPQLKHKKPISALSFSVEGSFAVSGSEDGTILIWDASKGDTVGRPLDTKSQDTVNAVAYSSKHQLLISSSGFTGAVVVWNANTHEVVFGPLECHTSSIETIAMSRDGRRALTASRDGTVSMWDLGGKGVIHVNESHTYRVDCVAVSPCGEKIASTAWDKIQVWNATSGQLLFKLDGQRCCDKVIFSPDGSKIVGYNTSDGPLGVWNADTGEFIFDLYSNDGGLVEHVSFRTTDHQLVTCSYFGTVSIGSVETSDPLPVVTAHNHTNTIIALSPNGLTAIVTVDLRYPGRYCLWSTITQQRLTAVDLTFASYQFKVCLSPSGQFLVSVEESLSVLRVWNTWTGEVVAVFPKLNCKSSDLQLAFSPDDRHIAISFFSSDRPTIRVYDIHIGQMLSGPWSGHTDKITTLAFSPDGESLVSGSADRQVRVWRMESLTRDWRGVLGAGTYMEDGWVKDADGKLLFWVPMEHRMRLVWPHCVPLGSSRTTLDLSRFRYGDHWEESFFG